MQEIAPVIEQDRNYRDQSPHPVHAVLNLSAAKHLPPGAISLRHASPDLNHPTAGQVVLVGTNTFVRNVAELIFRLSRTDKFKIFATEEEAWAYLRKVIAEAPQSKG